MPVDITALIWALPIVGLVVFGVYFIPKGWANHASPDDVSEPTPTGARGYFRAAAWVLAALYLAVGLPKLGALGDILHQFDRWGYSEVFMYTIGVAEFLGGIFLLIPRIRLFAAAGLSVVMIGAIYTHLAFDPALMTLMPATCLALLIYVGIGSYLFEWKPQPGGSVDTAVSSGS